MNDIHRKLTQVQKLVLDILKVERNHRIPTTKRRENVVEHSFSVAMLCWKLYSNLKPNLNLEKILMYALVHDFPERGQEYDINTYANQSERLSKQKQELKEIKKISSEFADFKDMICVISNYDNFVDEESRFVWSVDKMQAMILGGIDKWRPYKLYGVKYEQFYKKGDELLIKCSPCLKDIFKEVIKQSRKTFYDQPKS